MVRLDSPGTGWTGSSVVARKVLPRAAKVPISRGRRAGAALR